MDTSAYDEGHPPGAVAWNWTSQLQDQVQRDVASRDAVEGLLRGRGRERRLAARPVRRQQQLVRGLRALDARAVRRDQHRTDGRWPRQGGLAEGRATTTDAPAPAAGNISVAEREESSRAKLPGVLSHVGAGGQLVDVRSPDEFNGVIMAPAGPARDRAAQGPRARRLEHPLGDRGRRGRHVSSRPMSCTRSTAAAGSTRRSR